VFEKVIGEGIEEEVLFRGRGWGEAVGGGGGVRRGGKQKNGPLKKDKGAEKCSTSARPEAWRVRMASGAPKAQRSHKKGGGGTRGR